MKMDIRLISPKACLYGMKKVNLFSIAFWSAIKWHSLDPTSTQNPKNRGSDFPIFCFIFVRFWLPVMFSMGIVTSLANKGLANKG